MIFTDSSLSLLKFNYTVSIGKNRVMSQKMQTMFMPVAMVIGGVFHNFMDSLGFLTPYLIFVMLFIPFCGVNLKEMKITGLHINLLLFQTVMCVLAYAFIQLFDETVAQGAMICIIAPTATSAVVIAAMLGAKVSTMLTYSLLVNIAVAIGAPIFFAAISPEADISFWHSFSVIFLRVIPMLVLPFVIALLLKKFAPKAAKTVQKYQPVSFYLWLAALCIVTGRIVNFIMTQEGLTWGKGIALALTALVICVLQFITGRYIGRRYGDTVAGGQSLGQKNTILAIWLAQSYLNPVSSIAPASYVLWQTLINSYQLWRKGRKERNEEII